MDTASGNLMHDVAHLMLHLFRLEKQTIDTIERSVFTLIDNVDFTQWINYSEPLIMTVDRVAYTVP